MKRPMTTVEVSFEAEAFSNPENPKGKVRFTRSGVGLNPGELVVVRDGVLMVVFYSFGRDRDWSMQTQRAFAPGEWGNLVVHTTFGELRNHWEHA